MRICCVDRWLPVSDVDCVDFDSVRTLLDYDVVILDLLSISKTIKDGSLSDRITDKRREEILELLSLGRTIVAFGCDFQLQWLLPIRNISTVQRVGSRMDFKGPDQLKSFWAAVEGSMEYLAYFDGMDGSPFLFISETEKSVATWVKHDRGHILLLPWLIEGDEKHPSYQRTCASFVEALEAAITKLIPTKTTPALPAWTSQYGWEREETLRSNLVSYQKQATELTKKITRILSDLNVEEELKALFTAKGDVLVAKVIEVLRELGVKADGGEPGRDDIVIKFSGKNAVAEVKGKKKSAAEEDAAQLEKWVSGFKADKGVDPKGILFVNAFCETPLIKRQASAFPHQMLKYSMSRGHCLITTIQLLGLLLEARAHPEKRVDLVRSLFSTVGVYQQFSDWRQFLTSSSPAPAKAK